MSRKILIGLHTPNGTANIIALAKDDIAIALVNKKQPFMWRGYTVTVDPEFIGERNAHVFKEVTGESLATFYSETCR